MKVLCNCESKSESCTACYMANLEDWNNIHAIAMSAEAQRRLEEDLRFLESINVWHLVNLRSNPHPLYSYADQLDVLSSPQIGMYSQNPYSSPQHHQQQQQQHPNTFQYLSPSSMNPVGNANQHQQPQHHQQQQNSNGGTAGVTAHLSAPGYGTALPYPDLIIHTAEASPRYYPASTKHPPEPNCNNTIDINNVNLNIGSLSIKSDDKDYEEINHPIDSKNGITNYRGFSPSPILQHSPLIMRANSLRLKNLQLLAKEPDDYDAEESHSHHNISISGSAEPGGCDGKNKAVSFTADTIFVERDMDSPFWRAFTERRRLRRINRQRRHLNAQIASASYQPSLVEIVRSAFSSNRNKDSNGNCTSTSEKKKSGKCKGEVLVYDNSSQIPESYTTQYIYTAPPPSRSHKIFQMLTCQCCSAPSC